MTTASETQAEAAVEVAEETEFSRCLDHPSGYFALSSRNLKFQLPGTPGFIAYREQGRHWVAFGGVHAAIEQREDLLRAFVESAAQQRRRYMVVQVREDQVALFRKFGATVNQLGSSFAITLEGYSFAGSKKMKLRNKVKRATKAGCRVEEIGRELARSPEAFKEVHTISDRWLKKKGKKELDFMIGEIGSPKDRDRRIFLVRDKNNKAVAFISYVPVWGSRRGFLHDLTRKLPEAPTGAMELCNRFAMERFMEEKVPYLHFGFTPFIADGEEPEGHSKTMAWLVRKLRKHGRAVYPAESQMHYKTKWGTDIIEQEYIAAAPLSLRAAWDILLLTRSL